MPVPCCMAWAPIASLESVQSVLKHEVLTKVVLPPQQEARDIHRRVPMTHKTLRLPFTPPSLNTLVQSPFSSRSTSSAATMSAYSRCTTGSSGGRLRSVDRTANDSSWRPRPQSHRGVSMKYFGPVSGMLQTPRCLPSSWGIITHLAGIWCRCPRTGQRPAGRQGGSATGCCRRQRRGRSPASTRRRDRPGSQVSTDTLFSGINLSAAAGSSAYNDNAEQARAHPASSAGLEDLGLVHRHRGCEHPDSWSTHRLSSATL